MEWRGDFQRPLLERERVEFFMRKPLIYTPLLGRGHWSQPRQLRWLRKPLGQQADRSGGEFHPQHLRASRHAGQRLGVDVFGI